MAYYGYKELRDCLMDHGKLDECGNPVDKETHGPDLEVDYNGNIHRIAAELIKELSGRLKESNAK